MPFDPNTVEPPDPQLVAALRTMSCEERLAIAARMWRSARDSIRCMLAHEHPDWSSARLSC
jgi:hypothetical protein